MEEETLGTGSRSSWRGVRWGSRMPTAGCAVVQARGHTGHGQGQLHRRWAGPTGETGKDSRAASLWLTPCDTDERFSLRSDSELRLGHDDIEPPLRDQSGGAKCKGGRAKCCLLKQRSPSPGPGLVLASACQEMGCMVGEEAKCPLCLQPLAPLTPLSELCLLSDQQGH